MNDPVVFASEVRLAAARVIACIDVLVKDGAEPGDPVLWRTIAAVALQMEARAMGLDYSLPPADKSLTPD